MTKAIYALLRAKFNCANEYGSNGACVCVLHDQTNITLDLFAMKRYHRVFARTLDSKTNWYAFNDSLDGYQPNRNQQQNIAFKKLAGDVR